MVTAPALQSVPSGKRQRRIAERHERHRFVHVMPHPGEPLRQPLPVQPSPPLAHPRLREVREDRLTRPHLAAHPPPPPVPHEGVRRRPAVVHRVARLRLHRRIHDRHQPHSLPAQLRRQPRQIREPLAVHREHPVPPKVVDVQMERRQRQPPLPVPGHHPPHLARVPEPPARVVVPQRPRGRQRGRARQRRPRVQHPRRRPRHHPVAQRPAVHPHLAAARPVVPRPLALHALPQRHPPVPRVVVEDQMRAAVRHHQLHRHRQIQRIVPRLEGPARIGVPQPVRAVPQPGPRRPAAQPEEPRVRRHLGPLHPPCTGLRVGGTGLRVGGPLSRVRRLRRIRPRAPPVRRLPPARRQIPPQHHAPRRPYLHRAVPVHHHQHPLRQHPPAAVRIRLQHRPLVHRRTRPRQRVRRLRLGPVPAAEHRAARRDPNPKRRPREPHHTAARLRLGPLRGTRHPCPLRTAPRQPGRVQAPPPHRRTQGPQPPSRTD